MNDANATTDTNNWNKLLTENTADLINWIKSAAETTGSFITEQTPIFIREYLSWYFWDNMIGIILWAIVAFICLGTGIVSFKKLK